MKGERLTLLIAANYSDSLNCSGGVPTGASLMIRPALRTAPLQRMLSL
jgi:hypothetical protein